MRVLLVCTGNICRSPMAEGLMRAMLSERQADVGVASAGLLSSGNPSTSEMIQVMQTRGLDMSAHRSRDLRAALELAPDLVIAMAKEHAAAVAEADAKLGARTFTLKALARAASGSEVRGAEEPLEDYLSRIGVAPPAASGVSDDVSDPFGLGIDAYRACADELETLVEIIVDRVLAPGQTRTGGPLTQTPGS